MITVLEFYESLRETLKSTAGIEGSSIESEFLRYALDKLVDYGDINSYEMVEDGRDSGGIAPDLTILIASTKADLQLSPCLIGSFRRP